MTTFPKGRFTMLKPNFFRIGFRFALLALIALSLLLVSSVSFAQTTVAQGVFKAQSLIPAARS